jgi:hypothetical protein
MPDVISFLSSAYGLGALALLGSGFALGWLAARWRSRRDWRASVASRAPRMIELPWKGYGPGARR